jgi:hypothetical protein
VPSKSKPKRSFGQIARLPSRRYRARYTGPDTALHNAPHTFEARIDAEAWLTDERRLIVGETWTPPRDREAKLRGPLTFASYSASWLAATSSPALASTTGPCSATSSQPLTMCPSNRSPP